MTALPDQCFDFDSELEPATPAFFSVFAWTRRTRVDPDYVDEVQAWADDFSLQPRWPACLPVANAPLDVVLQINVAAGEHFRGSWRRRLADAQGDCGYVARQMRKAGVPLDLALAVLLIPLPLLEAAQKSSLTPAPGADSRQVEAIQVHDLVPGRHEVTHEHLPGIAARIDLRQGAEL